MLAFALLAATWFAEEPFFYGGDFDGRTGLPCERNTVVSDFRIYDDFRIRVPTTIRFVWGNYLIYGFVPTTAYFEIRRGISAGNGGVRVAGDAIVPALAIPTGRSRFGIKEYQVRAWVGNWVLPPDTYHVTLAPVGRGYGRSFVVTTSARNEGPEGDPNPIPVGEPLANGNSFYDSNYFGDAYGPVEALLGEGPWDFSFGLSEHASPKFESIRPDRVAIERGRLRRGSLNSLFEDDWDALELYGDPGPRPGIWVARCTADWALKPTDQLLWLQVFGEGRPASTGGFVEAFDHAAGRWTMLGKGNPLPSDHFVRGLSHLIDPVTGRFSIRITWTSVQRGQLLARLGMVQLIRDL